MLRLGNTCMIIYVNVWKDDIEYRANIKIQSSLFLVELYLTNHCQEWSNIIGHPQLAHQT